MKRVFTSLLLVLLCVNAWLFWRADRRYNSPSAYSYITSASVDRLYYDQNAVLKYFELAEQIGSFARLKWFNEDIDVFHVEEGDIEAKEAADYYQEMLRQVKEIEQRLIVSANLKSKGFTNNEIFQIEKVGESEFQKQKVLNDFVQTKNQIFVQRGDVGEVVVSLQQKLVSMGYRMPQDGKFGFETELGLRNFQKEHNLSETGKLDMKSAKKILEVLK